MSNVKPITPEQIKEVSKYVSFPDCVMLSVNRLMALAHVFNRNRIYLEDIVAETNKCNPEITKEDFERLHYFDLIQKILTDAGWVITLTSVGHSYSSKYFTFIPKNS